MEPNTATNTAQELTLDWNLVTDAGGVGLSITGMTIVFTTLVLISLFIAALPHVLSFLDKYAPWLMTIGDEHGGPGHGERKGGKGKKGGKAQARRAAGKPMPSTKPADLVRPASGVKPKTTQAAAPALSTTASITAPGMGSPTEAEIAVAIAAAFDAANNS